MSPTTLYREGADLDVLLAELDSQYPDRVHVVDISHPRDGGFLGFFAKQRVGVHYRLLDPRFAQADGEPASRFGLEFAESPDGSVVSGPEGAAAGLPEVDGAWVSHDDDRAASPGPLVGQDDSGTQFAQILAELALRKAGQAAGMPGGKPAQFAGQATRTPAATAAARRFLQPEPTEHAGSRNPITIPAQAETGRAPIRLGPSPEALESAQTASITASAAASSTATTLAGAPGLVAGAEPATAATSGTPASPTTRTKPRAVARFQPPSSARDTTPPADSATVGKEVTPAFGSLPEFSADGRPAGTERRTKTRSPSSGATRPATSTTSMAAPTTPSPATGSSTDPSTPAGAEAGATPGYPPASHRGAGLHWPLAATDYSSAAPPALTRQRLATASAAHEDTASQRNASYDHRGSDVIAIDRTDTATGAANFALRRQLVEIGVPVTEVPGDAAHAYAAVEQLVSRLPEPPSRPHGPGQILVIAGPARDAVAAAETVVVEAGAEIGEVWSYGCATGIGQRALVSKEQVIGSVTHAREVAADLRTRQGKAAVIIIATDGPTWTDRPAELIEATEPDSVWAVVDATWKPGDTTRVLRRLGAIDGIAVANAERSTSPATVWEISAPIALLDGRPSSASAWAVLLLGKLSELEQQCSADQS